MSDDSKKKTVDEIDFEKLANDKSASRFNKFVTLILLAICIVLAAFIIFRMVNAKDSAGLAVPVAENTETTVNVSASPATIKDFSKITRLNAEVTSDGQSVSVYPDITTSGTITEILISRGQNVDKGDIIAYIDPSRPGASYKESPVVAKTSGIVTEIPVTVGQLVSASQPIAVIAVPSELKIEGSIPEKFLGTVAVGMNATMETVAYPGRYYTGTLTYIAPTVNAQTRSSDIEIQPTGDLTGLREGMYVRLNLETEHIDDALTVPEAAIKTYLNNDVVYIADNGTARRQIVTVGSSNGEDTVITSGLNEGDMVITAGNVTDGTSISVVESQEN